MNVLPFTLYNSAVVPILTVECVGHDATSVVTAVLHVDQNAEKGTQVRLSTRELFKLQFRVTDLHGLANSLLIPHRSSQYCTLQALEHSRGDVEISRHGKKKSFLRLRRIPSIGLRQRLKNRNSIAPSLDKGSMVRMLCPSRGIAVFVVQQLGDGPRQRLDGEACSWQDEKKMTKSHPTGGN